MAKKQKYKSYKDALFFDFLPDEVFENLTLEELENYRAYRKYHFFIHRSNQKILDAQKEIDRLKKTISKEQEKQIGKDGWKKKLKMLYDEVAHLDKQLQVKVSLEIRKQKSKSLKRMQSKTNSNPSEIRSQDQYGGKPLTENVYIYARIKDVSENVNIAVYLGKFEKLKSIILPYLSKEQRTCNIINPLRNKIKQIISGYARYSIYQTSWQSFADKKHNLNSVDVILKQFNSRKKEFNKWCQ